MQVISDITGQLADCTICEGILGCDGVRRGAMADIDLFASFSVDCREAIRHINLKEGADLPLPRHGVMLWECLGLGDLGKKRKGVKSRHNPDVAKKLQDLSRQERLLLYVARAERGEEIVPIEEISDDLDNNYQKFLQASAVNLD